MFILTAENFVSCLNKYRKFNTDIFRSNSGCKWTEILRLFLSMWSKFFFLLSDTCKDLTINLSAEMQIVDLRRAGLRWLSLRYFLTGHKTTPDFVFNSTELQSLWFFNGFNSPALFSDNAERMISLRLISRKSSAQKEVTQSLAKQNRKQFQKSHSSTIMSHKLNHFK